MRERLKRVVLKTTEPSPQLVCNRLETNEPDRPNAERSGDCSKTVVVGEVAERLMAPVLKTGIP
jgi:hypothetical protein